MSERRGSSRRPAYAIDEHSLPMLRRAAAQARELGYDAVGRTLLVLGILADESCPAARLLRRHGVRADRLRDKLDMPLDGTHERSPEDATCLNAQATFAMSGASILARRTGTREITPMHLLLALMIPPDAADAFGLRHDQIESLREDARAALDA